MTLQEIQYKAQNIIHKWRDDNSAPYIEFVEELAHMIVPESFEDFEEAAIQYAMHKKKSEDKEMETELPMGAYYLAKDSFIAGAKWQKEQIMKDAVEGHIVSKNDGWNSIELPSTFFGELSKNYKDGDKIKVIIVKEEN